MIKIAQKPTYTHKVKAELPGDDGKTINTTFSLSFFRLTQTELDEMAKSVNEKKMTDNDVLKRVVAGFGPDVQDEDGNALEFNEDNLMALADVFPLRPAMIRAYYASLETAKAKN